VREWENSFDLYIDDGYYLRTLPVSYKVRGVVDPGTEEPQDSAADEQTSVPAADAKKGDAGNGDTGTDTRGPDEETS